MNEHKFAYVVFSDPSYQPGWVARDRLPTKKDTLTVGVGVIVEKGEDYITLSLFEGFDGKETDVFHPMTIPHIHIVKMYTFSEDLINDALKRRSKNIHRHIDRDVRDFYK